MDRSTWPDTAIRLFAAALATTTIACAFLLIIVLGATR